MNSKQARIDQNTADYIQKLTLRECNEALQLADMNRRNLTPLGLSLLEERVLLIKNRIAQIRGYKDAAELNYIDTVVDF